MCVRVCGCVVRVGMSVSVRFDEHHNRTRERDNPNIPPCHRAPTRYPVLGLAHKNIHIAHTHSPFCELARLGHTEAGVRECVQHAGHYTPAPVHVELNNVLPSETARPCVRNICAGRKLVSWQMVSRPSLTLE